MNVISSDMKRQDARTYEYTEQRSYGYYSMMQGCSKAISIQKAYGWSMPMLCIEFGKRMGRVARDYASRMRYAFLYVVALLVMILVVQSAWGQTNFSGVWYIANYTNHDNSNIGTHWYLVPGADPQQPHYADAYFNNEYCNKSGSGDYTGDNYGDPEKPFLTTYQTSQDLNSIWVVVSTGDGYYNIVHAKTGKYIVYEPPYKDVKNRKSMHLESTNTPGENANLLLLVVQMVLLISDPKV